MNSRVIIKVEVVEKLKPTGRPLLAFKLHVAVDSGVRWNLEALWRGSFDVGGGLPIAGSI